MNNNETFDNNKIRPRKKLIKLILLILSYVLLAVIVWQVTKSHSGTAALTPEEAQKELTETVEKVGKLMILPTGETPQVAIIQDVDALKKSQDFFADAENGDKILVYTQARKAIIYRESTNKIVNVVLNIGPVTDDSTSKPVDEKKEEVTTSKATTTSKTASTSDEQ